MSRWCWYLNRWSLEDKSSGDPCDRESSRIAQYDLIRIRNSISMKPRMCGSVVSIEQTTDVAICASHNVHDVTWASVDN